MAADLAVPQHVFVHGFLLGADGRKMSKSLGNVLDPFEVIDQFGTDALRFYLLRDVSFGADGAVGMDAARTRYESELANEYGNLASRTIAMISRYRDGVDPRRRARPGARCASSMGSPNASASCSTGPMSPTALEVIWQRVRRCNRYVEERAPWQLARDPADAGALDQTLASLAEALRALTVMLHAYMPASTRPAARHAGGARPRVFDGASARRDRRRADRERNRAPVPEARVIDSHTHLDACEPPVAELVAAAEAAGVTRILTVGTDGASCRAALAAAEDFPQVYAAIGRHPSEATGFDDADFAELQALASHEKCVAIGETGLDYYRDYSPREDQQRAFEAQIELARETGKPLVIHTRAADDETLATLDAHAGGLRVILHCFSMASRVRECLAHEQWWFSFAGNATYPKAQDLREAAIAIPSHRLLVETDAPYLAPQPVRGKPNQPANVVATAEALALERRVSYAELERSIEDTAAAVFGW